MTNRIAELRKERKLSQAELAEAVAAAGEDVDFVPELSAPATDLTGSVLVLQG